MASAKAYVDTHPYTYMYTKHTQERERETETDTETETERETKRDRGNLKKNSSAAFCHQMALKAKEL